MSIKYFMNDSPVNIDWQHNEETNELQLILNNKVEPLIIKLNKSNLSADNIVAKYKNRIVGVAKPYEIGVLKKRILADVYKIKHKYMED